MTSTLIPEARRRRPVDLVGGLIIPRALLAFVLLTSCTPDSDLNVTPPPGYRALLEAEYPSGWKSVSGIGEQPDRAVGDFNGDGAADHARLWVAESSDGWILMAYLSGTAPRATELIQSDRSLQRQVLRTIKPGIHRSHRYHGIGLGPADSTAVVNLVNDALNLSVLESEGVTYVWNNRSGTFEALAMY